MAKKGKKKVAAEIPAEALHHEDELQEEDPYQEGMFKEDEGIRQRTGSPSLDNEHKLEYPPLVPINGVASPALSALADEDDAGFDTRAWARDIPYGRSPNIAPSPQASPANHLPIAGGFGTSPSGPAFSLAGSPSTQPFDRNRPPPNDEFRGGFGGASPGISPRAGFRPPSKAGDVAPAMSPRGRPLSIPSTFVPPSNLSQRPQAHFRGVSEAEIGMIPSRSTSGMRESQDLVIFDQAFYDGNVGDVVLTGSNKALYVYKLDRDKLTLIGTLTGLRGTVIAARMLPPSDSDVIEPIVALIVHGPALVESGKAPQPALSQHEAQTTVEIYAIKSSRHLATLYRTPPIPHNHYTRLADSAHAIGALALQVAGRFITVTSGVSGEVYIFEAKHADDDVVFQCIGKTWTSMPAARQRSYSLSSASSGATVGREESPGSQSTHEMGVVSLSQRWIAFVPPPASSQTTLRGEIGVGGTSNREPPGLMAHTPPAPSSANCEAETPLEEHFVNKIARDGYQEVQKGAKWAAERGLSAVKSYWGKPEAGSVGDANTQQAGYGQQAAFPPTHALENPNRNKLSQTCISVVDLERLSESNSLRPDTMIHPVTTFPVRYGCRYLSFGPTGLNLFAATDKGDVSYVWCLMRMVHGNISTPQGDISATDSHASVRQVARYTRMSESNIVDVAWTKPRGEKLAILTERGTVHIHDLPASAFRWPPPTHLASPATTPGGPSDTASQQSQNKGTFGSAMSWVTNANESIQAAVKSRPSFSGASLGGVAYAAGARGSRMMAAGFSKSVDAVSVAASNWRHSGENRLRLPGSSKACVIPGAVNLLSSKYADTLAITGTSIVRLHSIRLAPTDGGKGKRSVAGEQIVQLTVPRNEGHDNSFASNSDGLTVRGQWFADTRSHGFRATQPQPQPLSFAEIETSTPYKPFHNDHRVTMNTYVDDRALDREGLEDWEFGEDIETLEVGDEELPSGSMNLAKHEPEPNFDEEPDFEEGKPLPPPPASVAKPSKPERKSKRTRRPEPRPDSLIDVYDEDTAAGVPVKTSRNDNAFDEFEDEGLPFGQNSEFGF